jgi:hypothetical protein
MFLGSIHTAYSQPLGKRGALALHEGSSREEKRHESAFEEEEEEEEGLEMATKKIFLCAPAEACLLFCVCVCVCVFFQWRGFDARRIVIEQTRVLGEIRFAGVEAESGLVVALFNTSFVCFFLSQRRREKPEWEVSGVWFLEASKSLG